MRTTDVLAEVARAPRARAGQVVVGFAAETGDADGDVLTHGRAKLAAKGADLLVVNEVGATGTRPASRAPDNAAVVLGADGTETAVPLGPKEALADVVWDLVRRAGRPRDLSHGRQGRDTRPVDSPSPTGWPPPRRSRTV